jgi:hypothetical protein
LNASSAFGVLVLHLACSVHSLPQTVVLLQLTAVVVALPHKMALP